MQSNFIHVGQFYMNQNMLQQKSLQYGFQNVCSPNDFFHQIAYLKLKNKDSIIYGLPYHFCFFVQIKKIIRNHDQKYYYYYDLRKLAQILNIEFSLIKVILFYSLIFHICEKKSNRNYIVFETFKQQQHNFEEFYNQQMKNKANNLIDILLYLKTQVLIKNFQGQFMVICKHFQIPYLLFTKIQKKWKQNMVYDNDKHKLINFDFEDNKYVEHSDQYFNSKSYEFCYVCLLPVCFSHLLNVKKDTITFQSSQQYLINQTNNDFSEQCQKNINFQIIQRLIPLIFQKVPKLIVFKQFYIIDYFRFTEKFGSQTLDIQKFQDSLVQENKLKNNLYIKIMQNLQLTNYNEQQKLVILQLCCNVSIFQQKFDEKDLQFSKFINFMQNKNQKLQISLMLLYCLKFNFFSIRNFITTNNFYEKNWHKQKKIQKLDDKIFFEYQSELCSRDFFFTLIQNQNMQWKKSRMQTQSQFQKFVKQQRQGQQVLIQKAILSNEQHSQNASNQTQDAEFFLQNILWQTEQNNTFCNRFQNQENIKLITHKIYQRVNQFLQKDRQLNWDQIIIPVINLHESVNLACFIYLIISQPGNFYCCNDIVIQRQALFINWIRDKFHSLIKVNLLYNCVDDSKDTSQSVDQLQQKLKDSTNLINLFSNCCSPESTATFKELLITQAIKLYVTKQFPTLEKYFLKKVKQLKKKLASKNVSLEQFILYMEIFINAFKESQLHQSNQVFYNTLKSCFNLLQTF